ncbi:MAG: hypothetical protein IJC09_07200 [Clostridia bacterium]|nr:hypothetical protein [Clostridia bacterium]
MNDVAVMKEIQELEAIYEKRWGKPVDFIGMPSTITQESFLLVMRLIIETGESVLVGFEKTKHLTNTSI